ncbi:MAG: HAD family hydrolase [Rhodospirillales bacterium]
MPPDLIIFDCDGVLVDSEALGGAILVRLMRARGSDITLDEVDRRYRGMVMEEMVADFFERLGQPYDPSFPGTIRDQVNAALSQEVEAVPGALDLVRQVQAAGLPCCVASSGALEKMRITLGRTGLLPLLGEVLFTAQDVPRGKPAPDVFLHAARVMGADPAGCLVIEDSPAGVRAAVAAGMQVVGYSGARPDEAKALASLGATPVAQLSEVPALIGLG